MSELKTFFKKKEIIFLFAIAALGLFLRLYKLKENFYYTMDEEVMNLIQRRIVLGQHFPLIGSVSAIGTYLGPIFYYFGAGVLFLSKLNPLGQGIFAAILGTMNILFIYKVTGQLFNKTTGMIAAFLYSTSFLMVIFDRRFWHLMPGPFLSLIVLWSIYKIKKGSLKFIYPLVLAIIFGINTDYTNAILILFTIVCWVVFQLPLKKKEVLVAFLLLVLSNIPLLVFDLRHDFLNTRKIVAYFTQRHIKAVVNTDREVLGNTGFEQAVQSSILPFITLSRLFYTISDLNISEQHTYCKPYIVSRNKAQGFLLPGFFAVILVIFFYLTYKSFKQKNNLGYKLVALFYFIFQTGILGYAFFLKGDVFEHYLATLMPYMFIIVSVVLASLYSKKWRILVYGFLFIFIISNIILITKAYNPFGFKNKMNAVKYALNQVGDDNFSLDSLSSCYRWDGFYYPFVYFGRHPEKSYQDPNYSWLFDYKVSEKHPNKIVVIVPKGRLEDKKLTDTYNRYQQWVSAKEKFGGLEVLILDNSKGDFR